MYKLGIDLGASHIGLGLVKNNKLTKKKYITYNPPSKIYNKIFNKKITEKYCKFLIREIDLFVDNKKINYIGIGCPGGYDPENTIFYGSKALVVGKINFKRVLAKYKVPVYIDNDCNCAAIAEAKNTNLNEFLMITIGTGVGFSLINKKSNEIFLAKDEVIWKILNINKIPNSKHNKYIASFKYLSNQYNKKVGKKLKREAIFLDNASQKELLEKYISNFVTGINLLNDQLGIKNICIGGSFSIYSAHYLNKLKDLLPEYNIFFAKNFNDSGIIGATNLPVAKIKKN